MELLFRHCQIAGRCSFTPVFYFKPLPYTWAMTTLIAFQGPDFAILGADSQVTDGDKRIISPSTPKIVKLKKYLR